MDSVDGGSFICWEVFLAPEALTRALKVRASRGRVPLPLEIWQIYVLSSAISCILTLFLRWDAFSLNISSSESNCHSKKNSEMFRNECVLLDSFQNANI